MARPTTVSSLLQLRLVVPGAVPLPVRAGLSYDAADPYAVTVDFHTGGPTGSPGVVSEDDDDVVSWTFARALLTDGVSGPAGAGDVQVWPSSSAGERVVCLSLSSPSGTALFEVPLGDLVDFLGQTYDAVPTGAESEHVDVEGELALLLGSEPGA